MLSSAQNKKARITVSQELRLNYIFHAICPSHRNTRRESGMQVTADSGAPAETEIDANLI